MSQTFGKTLRETGSNGVVYNSVRNPNGSCIAAFWPNAVGIPVQAQHIKYHWNGAVIDKYFDYQEDEWIALAA
jgi:hypothetical protein